MHVRGTEVQSGDCTSRERGAHATAAGFARRRIPKANKKGTTMSAAKQHAELPLMPKATAVWLVENTTLSFEQIASFCGMHPLEVQGIADGEVAQGIIGQDPTILGQVTAEQIAECEKDHSKSLLLAKSAKQYMAPKTKGTRYTPVARRRDKPDAIAWLVKTHPELTDAQIIKLIGTTKSTIAAIRNRSHWNSSNLKPRDPVLLGICSQVDLNKAVERSKFDKGGKENAESPTA